MRLTSPAFAQGEAIPKQHTCDAKNLSPELRIADAPQGTKTLALVMDDPDAPRMVWDHWLLFNIPPDVGVLPEGVGPEDKFGDGPLQGAAHGLNSFGRLGYGGPCPPGGTHRYYFKLYALDTRLNLKAGVVKADLSRAMNGHILAECFLMGTCAR